MAIQPQESILLTTSCTTGWADWVHGELWLCPEGLLRLSLGWGATIGKSIDPVGAAVDEGLKRKSRRQFAQDDIRTLAGRKRTNVWIPWSEIREGFLRGGIMTGRLRLICLDGRSLKFLWMRDRRVLVRTRPSVPRPNPASSATQNAIRSGAAR